MELMTRIDIPASEWKMKASAKVLLLGSCFADEIGEKMVRGGFEAMVNPFGTLYNPASIAASLLRSVSEKEVEIPPLHENRPVPLFHIRAQRLRIVYGIVSLRHQRVIMRRNRNRFHHLIHPSFKTIIAYWKDICKDWKHI